ncbi:Nucleoid-associated protein [Planctomycetes bacterium Pla163]|uniref:Nucleoid-associated protein Pla163_28870 n=1 Tax=Rohdeia mirabilis TaxID=2528008 RepID=A0A518D2P1_9BACT|nr:Nucleoid-associated protein [Planctomycetes bacterium Pla163]
MAGAFGEMGNLLKQAQEMQKQLERLREELDLEVVEGSAGGGAVRIKLSGYSRQVLGVEIADEAVRSGEAKMVSELFAAALKDALTKVEALANEKLGKATGGIKLPGF